MKLLSVRLQNPLNFSIGQTLKGLALCAVQRIATADNPDPDLAPGSVRVSCVWRSPLLNLARY